MSEALSFRPMTEADLDAVLKIEYAAFSHPWTRGIFLDGLGKYQIWLMFEGEQQVGHGVVQIILDEAHLLNITVKPENQGRGLGLALLEHLMSRAYAANARECFLEVRDSNTGAFRLYERYGFNEIGRRRDYYPAVGRPRRCGRDGLHPRGLSARSLVAVGLPAIAMVVSPAQSRASQLPQRPRFTAVSACSAVAVDGVDVGQLGFIQPISAANLVFIDDTQVPICLLAFPGFLGIPRAIFMDQRFGAHVIVSRFMIIRRSTGHPGLSHAFVGHQVLALAGRDLIANFRRRCFLVKIQLAHRAHAVFGVINGFGLRSTVGTS
ncbi:ribosomal-protein-alanine acetyltransferase [Pseudomonas lurida]